MPKSIDGEWLLATNRGLLQLDSDSDRVRTLIARPIMGMARASGDRIVFTDGVSLFVASLPTLQSGRVEEELHLGRGFHPQRVARERSDRGRVGRARCRVGGPAISARRA